MTMTHMTRMRLTSTRSRVSPRSVEVTRLSGLAAMSVENITGELSNWVTLSPFLEMSYLLQMA